MNDQRLIGRWRSDSRRTRKELAARRDISAKARQKLAPLFGKWQIEFTRTRLLSILNQDHDSVSYQVIGKDDSSVAILSNGTITHIHFEKSGFWINVGTGLFREFFRRVERGEKKAARGRRRTTPRPVAGLSSQSGKLVKLLRGKCVGVVWRHRSSEIGTGFKDGTRLFVNSGDALDITVT